MLTMGGGGLEPPAACGGCLRWHNPGMTIRLCAALSAALLLAVPAVHAADPPPPTGPFVLPELPYAYDALEPHIDAETMRIHHQKHHAAYVNNANKALAGHPDLAKMTVWELVAHLDEVPEDIRPTLRNNAGGHANHSLFWLMMKPGGGGKPAGDLAKAIDEAFGSFEDFKKEFTAASMKVFGSGWAWLSVTPDGDLVIETTPNQDSPLMSGGKPVLALDVWEHAYYLKNQNRRTDYIDAWWKVVDWDYAAKRHAEATGE
jgi:superoxide dismutase, Fe-Mn family